ncbi:hypothetical protein A6S26_17105 [Nostoc sp. ATCC 43529]|nr:hypothetical protein A6S26_17105 [Nostoc sp. ATCC 43529]
MGLGLFDKYTHLVRQADQVVGYSIKELCLEDTHNVLDQTQYAQVALYVVNCLYYLEELRQTGVQPTILIGHSLGELNSLFVAGVYDFITGIELVAKRGSLMQQMSGGTMAAVLGLELAKLKNLLLNFGFERIDIANLNSPQQTVIAGPIEDIERAKLILEKNGAQIVIPLKVNAAFHSRYMHEAGEKFAVFLKDYEFSEPKIPVISNYSARPYQLNDVIVNLSRQISSPVRWTDSITYLLQQQPKSNFMEVGSKKSLTKMVEQIKASIG